MSPGGSYLPDHLEALKQGRRANAGREGTTRAHGSSWRRRRRRRLAGCRVGRRVVDRRDRPRRRAADAGRGAAGRGRGLHRPVRRRARRARVAGWWCATASHQPREVLTAAGAVEVVAPRVNDRRVDPDTGERAPVLLGDPAAVVPAAPRRSPRCCRCCTCTGCPPGTSCPALGQFLGSTAGLSAAVITKLTETWQSEAARLRRPGPLRARLRLLWVDGIHVNVRLEEAQAVPAGADRRPRRRPQGTRRARRRLPGVDRVLGRPAA